MAGPACPGAPCPAPASDGLDVGTEVGELAAGQFVLGLLVKEQVLLGRLVHADGDHVQTLEVLFLALRLHAVVVFLCPVGMQFAPARNALGHKPSLVLRAPQRREVKPRFHVVRA
jgi:hypothetical protein